MFQNQINDYLFAMKKDRIFSYTVGFARKQLELIGIFETVYSLTNLQMHHLKQIVNPAIFAQVNLSISDGSH